MSEKSAQTKKKLASNADKITIAVLVLLLLGLGYAWWQEQNNSLGKETVVEKPANLQDNLAENPSYEMLSNMSAQPSIDQSPEIQRVAQLNMFDFSTIEAERTIEAQAEAQLQQAQQLIEQGQTDQARELLLQARKVIAYRPELQQALDKVTTPTEGTSDAGADPSVM